MYCNKCGRAARNGDIFCSNCGNRLPIEADLSIPQVQSTYSPVMPPGYEQTVYVQNPQPPQEPPKPTKFIPEFEPEPKEQMQPHTEPEPQKPKESEFTWNVEDFKRTPKTNDEYEVDWKKLQIYEKHEDGRKTPVIERKEEIKPLTEADINRDMQRTAAAKGSAKIEKFYTFNQKLDEYQKLLDSEYERVNRGRQAAATPAAAAKVDEIQKAIKEGTEIDWDAISSRIDVESMAAIHSKPEQEPVASQEPQTPQKQPAAAAQQEQEQEQPRPMATTEERFTGFFEAIKSGEPAVPEEPDEEAPKEETGSIFDPVQHLKDAEAERKSIEAQKDEKSEAMNAVMDNESLMKRFDTKELEKDVLELEIEKERRRREKAAQQAQAQATPTEPTPAEAEPAAEPEAQAPAAEPEPAEPEAPAELASEEPAQAEPEPEAPTEPEAPAEPEPTAEPEASTEPESEPEPNPFDLIFGHPDEECGYGDADSDDEGADGEDGERKGGVLKALIIIAAILLGMELVLIGVQQLMPESGLAKFINKNLSGIVLQVGQSEKDEAPADDQATTDAAIEDEQAVKEGTPFPLTQLVEHAKNFNTNIVTVKADKNLCYNPTETYKEERITESQPLEYNIWYRDLNQTPIYSDMAVADTLVKYNSLWIDYINSGDETVFTLIAPDSKVYSNCKKASVGASEKIMKELALGEIREVSGGFLVWDRETITTTSKKGEITTATYEMVYYLADINFELKVAECYTLSSK